MIKKIMCVSVMAVGITSQAMALEPYIEGQLGFAGVADVDTKPFSGTTGGATFTNLTGTISYDEAFAFGAEAGIKDIGLENVRLSLGVARFNAEAEKVSVKSGTLSVSSTDAALLNALDNSVNLYTLNAYYDFNMESKFTPYVGIGAGLADIENAKSNEAALTLAAGVNYDLSEKAYVGLKGNYYRVAGPKDKTGLEFDTIQAYSFMATIGYRF